MRGGEQGKVGLRALAVFVGFVVSAVLISTVFFQWNLSGPGPLLRPRFSVLDLIRTIPRHLDWMVPFALLTALMVPFRALQWQRALQRKVPFRERYHLVAIGAFANNAIPGKLGDVIRSFLLSRSQNLPFVQSLGSVAVCKLLEFAALMLVVAASFLGPFGQTMGQFSDKLVPALVGCLALVLVVVLLAHFSGSLADALERRKRMPKLQHALVNIGEGLGTARSFRGMALALLFSAGPVLAASLAYGIGLRGLGIRGGLFAGAVVLGAIALGQSVPVGVGMYYAVTSWVARELGATEQQAAAYALLTHLCAVAAQLAVGAVSIRVRKIRWSELKRRTSLAAEAVRHATEHPAGDKPVHA